MNTVDKLKLLRSSIENLMQMYDEFADDVLGDADVAGCLDEAFCAVDQAIMDNNKVVSRVMVTKTLTYYVDVKHARSATSYDVEEAARDYVDYNDPDADDYEYATDLIDQRKDVDNYDEELS